jgi:hypothetical protein
MRTPFFRYHRLLEWRSYVVRRWVAGESHHYRRNGHGQMAPRRRDPEQRPAGASRNSGRVRSAPQSNRQLACQCGPGCGGLCPPDGAAPHANGKIAGRQHYLRATRSHSGIVRAMQPCITFSRRAALLSSPRDAQIGPPPQPPALARLPARHAHEQEESVASRRWRPSTTSGSPARTYPHIPRRMLPLATPATSEW